MKDRNDTPNRPDDLSIHKYRAKVTGRHAVTLPARLCRTLGVEPGDSVEFREHGGIVTLYRASAPEPLDLIGSLAGYYESMDDIIREIRDGRGTWTDEDEAEYQKNRQAHLAAASDS